MIEEIVDELLTMYKKEYNHIKIPVRMHDQFTKLLTIRDSRGVCARCGGSGVLSNCGQYAKLSCDGCNGTGHR